MMVSKVAVIALVVIVACPILLGYAMNLEETTHTDYVSDNDDLNVTDLLKNDTAYTYAHSDIYTLNTNSRYNYENFMIPVYNDISSVKSSYNLGALYYYDQSWVNATQVINALYFYEQFDYDPTTNSHTGTLYGMVGGVEQVVRTVNKIHSISYDQTTHKYICSYYNNSNELSLYGNTAELTKVVLNTVSGKADVYLAAYASNTYADLTSGFYFKGLVESTRPYISLPDNTKSVLFTINLDSITDANYRIGLDLYRWNYYLDKTTTGGIVKWTVTPTSDPSGAFDLYYDPSRTDNTYQIYASFETDHKDSTYYYYNLHREFRYVGGWPTAIGEAPSYMTFTDDVQVTSSANLSEQSLSSINFSTPTGVYNSRTPTIRVDDAVFRAYEYKVIENKTYDPATFREYPYTKITNPILYGTSIEFAGNTYNVKDGNITLGTHQIPVKDLVFSSVPVLGGYENKIGNTVISTTVQPSTITFNGKWSATITTSSMEEVSYTEMEWIAGSFGWDGMDHNFLIVGFLTSAGAFFAIAIHARRSNKRLWPALIVCAGAAILFFALL